MEPHGLDELAGRSRPHPSNVSMVTRPRPESFGAGPPLRHVYERTSVAREATVLAAAFGAAILIPIAGANSSGARNQPGSDSQKR